MKLPFIICRLLMMELLLVNCIGLDGQELQPTMLIKGLILDKETGKPLAYANIYNSREQKGTISNLDGYFNLAVPVKSDTLQVSFVGYEKQMIPINKNCGFYTIYMKENMQLLSDVVIRPDDNTYLYELIHNCKKGAPKNITKAKAYYELKSFIENDQIELVEAFYNVETAAYDLKTLEMKTGRLALQKFNNRLFTSQDGSQAIISLKLFNKNSYFPKSPTEMSLKKMKKYFRLKLIKKYANENYDSVYVLEFEPKNSTGVFFAGTIWIDQLHNQIIKINLNCNNCITHPFLPLFSSDSILNVDLNITRVFNIQNQKAVFDHVDFNYTIDYKSRIGKKNEYNYFINTQALLYAFDYNNLFFIPKFQFADELNGDYRKINAMPYNEFFWEKNNEFQLSDQQNLNRDFFNHPESLTSQKLFASNKYMGSRYGYFESPFLQWSSKRVILSEIIKDTLLDENQRPALKSDAYHLSIKIFMDMNSYSDSTDIITDAIIDPFESYYYLPMDNATHCFVNIYFDLIEIERRKLQATLNASDKKKETIEKVYNDFITNLKKLERQYLTEVDRGTNEKETSKWNEYVLENLGIDNIYFFYPFEENE